jgi:hypothetical protein
VVRPATIASLRGAERVAGREASGVDIMRGDVNIGVARGSDHDCAPEMFTTEGDTLLADRTTFLGSASSGER